MDTGNLNHWAASDWAPPLIIDDSVESTESLDWWVASDWAPPLIIPSAGEGTTPSTIEIPTIQLSI